jgi:hypothetical protein
MWMVFAVISPGDSDNRIAARLVRPQAGATEGNGSREHPFSDPWQALEKLEAGEKGDLTREDYRMFI